MNSKFPNLMLLIVILNVNWSRAPYAESAASLFGESDIRMLDLSKVWEACKYYSKFVENFDSIVRINDEETGTSVNLDMEKLNKTKGMTAVKIKKILGNIGVVSDKEIQLRYSDPSEKRKVELLIALGEFVLNHEIAPKIAHSIPKAFASAALDKKNQVMVENIRQCVKSKLTEAKDALEKKHEKLREYM
ncbi:hypothetical protein DdX_20119 [Ditylenchus destructor]|uniref:Uncharacterized protein n=1 Tax=Ditylenchus destructor TaxID=166010 RepID=A0AAD4QWN5_9BILA|nr:hypothetical protein DdX_20119 [Ditylenchus destructor]